MRERGELNIGQLLRERYGRELEALVDDLPGRTGVAFDLLLGAAMAYAAVIRGNRILSSAGAYLHGVCVAQR